MPNTLLLSASSCVSNKFIIHKLSEWQYADVLMFQGTKREWRWERGAFLPNSLPACHPLFLFTVNTLMPITPSLFPFQCDSVPACCPWQVSDFVLKHALTCRNICKRTWTGFTLVHSHTRAHPRRQFAFLSPNYPVSWIRVTMRCFWGRCGNKKVPWSNTCHNHCQQ